MNKPTWLLFTIYIITVLSLSNLNLLAEEIAEATSPVKTVTEVAVKQNKLISTNTILLKLQTKVGQPYSQQVVNDDIKRLYATGFFTDIKVDLSDYHEGLKVTFAVSEKPILEAIIFKGNRIFNTKKLQQAIKSKSGEMLEGRQLKEDIEAIERLYENKGFPLVNIEHKIKTDPEANKATVEIFITEGTRLKIKRINIQGNQAFSDKRILKLLRTRPASLFRSGVFKQDILEEDLEIVNTFYQNEGYIDVRASYDSSYSSNKRLIYLTINIEEGKKYLTGDISITGTKVLSQAEILERLRMGPDHIFSQPGLRSDINAIQTLYFEKGYIFAQVRTATSLNKKTSKVDITYSIIENDLAYVDKIKIMGNIKTKDIVIRRELRILPGEAFDGKKLQRSKERLYNLGYFEEVSYDVAPTSTADKRDLIVNVKEAKTGEFSFGGGYSTIDKIVGFIQVSQNNFDLLNFPNFTGGGQRLLIKAEFGSIRKDYELSFTEPWVFGQPYSFGLDLYRLSRERSTDIGYGYDEERKGGRLRLGKEFSDYLRGDLTYRLEEVNISNVSTDASADLKSEEGKNTISSLKFQVAQDSRDNSYNPSRGHVIINSVEGAGGAFGGDKDFVKYIGSTSWYFTKFEQNLLELRLRIGLADSYGDTANLPIYERFYAGGANTIRGYKERRVGPRDPSSNDPIGGNSMLVGNIEYTVPVVQYIKVAVFCDAGNVWSKMKDFGNGDFKYGAGVGVRVKTPIGPVRLDYGYPLNPDLGESKNGRFHFNISRNF